MCSAQVKAISRPIRWPFEADLSLLAQHWTAQHDGHAARLHVPGHSADDCSTRLQQLSSDLPVDAFNLWSGVDCDDERSNLVTFVRRLRTASGRQHIISGIKAKERAADAAQEQTCEFEDELCITHDARDVANLVRTLHSWDRNQKRENEWTVSEEVELVTRFNRCRQPDSQQLQQNIRIGSRTESA